MNRLYKYIIWFYMLTKRLLRQWSFIILLLLIPCSIFLISVVASRDSGVVHIMLCNRDDDEIASRIVTDLMKDDSVIRFSSCNSEKVARESVAYNKVDAAWIFPSDFSEKSREYISSNINDEPFVKIIERESSMTLQIAKEKLFGELYKDFSYLIYENFAYSELFSPANIENNVANDISREHYNSLEKGAQIVEVERLGKSPSADKTSNYLTAPIRGILSLMVLLCTLASMLYFLKEQAQGKFSWLPTSRRIVPALASCFSAAALSSVAMFITIKFTGMSTSLLSELFALLLYCISLAGFCVAVSQFFRSPGKFGAIIPALLIITLALSPIFFNMKILRPVRLLLPTYYYLHSIYNPKYFVYTLFYCFGTYTFCIILNLFLSRKKSFDSII